MGDDREGGLRNEIRGDSDLGLREQFFNLTFWGSTRGGLRPHNGDFPGLQLLDIRLIPQKVYYD